MHILKNAFAVSAIMLGSLGLVTAQVTYSTTWDKEVTVTHGEEEFPGKETLYAYSTVIYETDVSDIRKLVLEEINSRTADKTKKKALKEGVPVPLDAFDGEEITLKVKSEDVKKTEQVRVSVAFLKDSIAINPTDFPKEDKSAQEVMYNVGVNLNKAVVTAQVAESNKTLESLQKDFDKLVKDSTKLSESIRKSNELIAKYNADNVKQEQKLAKAEADAASLEVMANSDVATEKDMKKYSKAKSKASSIESTILKNNQKVTKEQSEIKGAEMELPMLRKQVEELAAKIESQKELISQLQAKLEAIK